MWIKNTKDLEPNWKNKSSPLILNVLEVPKASDRDG